MKTLIFILLFSGAAFAQTSGFSNSEDQTLSSVDMCSNIPGPQKRLPTGYKEVDGVCIAPCKPRPPTVRNLEQACQSGLGRMLIQETVSYQCTESHGESQPMEPTYTTLSETCQTQRERQSLVLERYGIGRTPTRNGSPQFIYADVFIRNQTGAPIHIVSVQNCMKDLTLSSSMARMTKDGKIVIPQSRMAGAVNGRRFDISDSYFYNRVGSNTNWYLDYGQCMEKRVDFVVENGDAMFSYFHTNYFGFGDHQFVDYMAWSSPNQKVIFKTNSGKKIVFENGTIRFN